MYESCIFASVLRSADRSAATPHAKRRNAKYSIPSHQDIPIHFFHLSTTFFPIGHHEFIYNHIIYVSERFQQFLIFASQVEQGICHLGVGHELAEVLFKNIAVATIIQGFSCQFNVILIARANFKRNFHSLSFLSSFRGLACLFDTAQLLLSSLGADGFLFPGTKGFPKIVVCVVLWKTFGSWGTYS